jgi:hypothetical protein
MGHGRAHDQPIALVVALPVSARRFSILLYVGAHEEVDQVALEQRSLTLRTG